MKELIDFRPHYLGVFPRDSTRNVSATPAELMVSLQSLCSLPAGPVRSGTYLLRPGPAVWSPPEQIHRTYLADAGARRNNLAEFGIEQTGSHAPNHHYIRLLFKIKQC